MKKEVIAEYTYELPEPTDEEIRRFFEDEGITDVNPEDVRMYIRKSIYNMLCQSQKQNTTYSANEAIK